MGETARCAVVTDAGMVLVVDRDASRLASETRLFKVLTLPVLGRGSVHDWRVPHSADRAVDAVVFTAHITAILPITGGDT